MTRQYLPGSTIAGNLLMTGAVVNGPLNMNSIKIGGDLLLDGKATFKAVTLADADIGSNMRFDGSHLTGTLAMPAAHIGHLLALGRQARFDDAVSLPFAKVDGGMVLSQSQFATKFGFPPATLRNREQGRARPDTPTRVLLAVIAIHPESVEDVLRDLR